MPTTFMDNWSQMLTNFKGTISFSVFLLHNFTWNNFACNPNWVPKKNYKIPLIFGGWILNFFFIVVFIFYIWSRKDTAAFDTFVQSSVRHNPMQQRPPESASLNWHTALWWVSIMAYVRSKEFQRKDALNIFLTGKQVLQLF